MSYRLVKSAYVLTCDGFPAGTCRNQFIGDTGQTLEQARRDAKLDGWLIKYGELCPRCVQEMLK